MFLETQIGETLSDEVLEKMHAAPKQDDVIDPTDLDQYDGKPASY